MKFKATLAILFFVIITSVVSTATNAPLDCEKEINEQLKKLVMKHKKTGYINDLLGQMADISFLKVSRAFLTIQGMDKDLYNSKIKTNLYSLAKKGQNSKKETSQKYSLVDTKLKKLMKESNQAERQILIDFFSYVQNRDKNKDREAYKNIGNIMKALKKMTASFPVEQRITEADELVLKNILNHSSSGKIGRGTLYDRLLKELRVVFSQRNFNTNDLKNSDYRFSNIRGNYQKSRNAFIKKIKKDLHKYLNDVDKRCGKITIDSAGVISWSTDCESDCIENQFLKSIFSIGPFDEMISLLEFIKDKNLAPEVFPLVRVAGLKINYESCQITGKNKLKIKNISFKNLPGQGDSTIDGSKWYIDCGENCNQQDKKDFIKNPETKELVTISELNYSYNGQIPKRLILRNPNWGNKPISLKSCEIIPPPVTLPVAIEIPQITDNNSSSLVKETIPIKKEIQKLKPSLEIVLVKASDEEEVLKVELKDQDGNILDITKGTIQWECSLDKTETNTNPCTGKTTVQIEIQRQKESINVTASFTPVPETSENGKLTASKKVDALPIKECIYSIELDLLQSDEDEDEDDKEKEEVEDDEENKDDDDETTSKQKVVYEVTIFKNNNKITTDISGEMEITCPEKYVCSGNFKKVKASKDTEEEFDMVVKYIPTESCANPKTVTIPKADKKEKKEKDDDVDLDKLKKTKDNLPFKNKQMPSNPPPLPSGGIIIQQDFN